jgi:hypothetical protein
MVQMNANELADELEKDIYWIQDELARKWVVDMLRQQQAEIESYKNPIMQAIAMAFDPLTDDEIDMLAHEYNCIDDYPHEFVRACIRKAQR